MSEPFSKEKIYIVEIDLPFCDLQFGVSPCLASGSGDSKCFNTLASCQSIAAYNANNSLKTYRFCEQVSPHPVGLDAVPNLASVSISPAQIQLDGGLGVRSNVNLTFNDHPSSDLIIDPYVNDRTYNPFLRGTYWGKFRVRNPFYQNAPLRLISAYIVDGAVDLANATTYHYVLEELSASKGQCSIIAKDPLKLADNKRAQAPKASNGELASDLLAAATTATLQPSGIGSEYPASGFIRISKEVLAFTRVNDVLTLTRGQYNTVAIDHSQGDKVQLCLEYSDTLDDILTDLLVNYADIDPTFIPSAFWASEVGDNLSGIISTLITEPTGVTKLIKELGEQFPHSLYWDERTQKIELTAIKPPPQDANVYDEDGQLIADSVTIEDKRDLRVSTVFVYYGQIDPTQKLDETNNYAGTYVRANLDSINRYGSNEIKTIFSRWITRDNKAAALRLAARIGRRFGTIPRAISFELDPKYKSVWAGQVVEVNHKYLPDFTGLSSNVLFQIITAQETDNFKYTGIEYNYDPALPEDEGGGDDGTVLLFIEGERLDYNIRTAFEGVAGAPDATSKVKVIIEGSATSGASTTSNFAIDTGLFPAGATIEIENRNLLIGCGGDGGKWDGVPIAPTNGGAALNLQHPVSINNLGIIGGGGGGGGYDLTTGLLSVIAGGGGGAGFNGGLRGVGDNGDILTQSENGANLTGGIGETRRDFEAEPNEATGGTGGGLGLAGEAGDVAGGLAGAAIVTNGNAITYINAGDIRGAVT